MSYEFGWLDWILNSELSALFWMGGLGIFVIAFVWLISKIMDRVLGLSAIAAIGIVSLILVTGVSLGDRSTIMEAIQPSFPQEVQIKFEDTGRILVTWETSNAVEGAIRYGFSEDNLSNIELEVPIGSRNTQHKIWIEEVLRGEVIYIKIISGGKEYPANGSVVVDLE